jgi:hypothetical protein
VPDQFRGLLDRNILTALAVIGIVVFFAVAAVAAVTGHYDSASVRAFIDDMKYVAGLLGLGAAVGRGVIAAGQRVADGHTEAAIVHLAGSDNLPGASTGLVPDGADQT